MPLRHREQDLRTTSIGSYTSPIGPTTTLYSKVDGFRRTCDDFIGNRLHANDFSLMEEFTYYPTLTCTSPTGHVWLEQPVGFRPGTWDPRNWYPVLTALDRSNKAWEILSKTNPSQAHISVPTFIGELKDLPGLVKGYGQGLLKAVSNGYLSWRWAIRPMIGDLKKLFSFVKAVDNRTTMLMKLRNGETLRKRVKLGTVRGSLATSNLVVESKSGGGCNGLFKAYHTSTAWGTVQWKLLPDSKLPTLGYGPLREMARNLTFGFTSHELLATAWELTPWSWLADWFGNTGDIIAATNNTVGCTWSDICYMRTSESNTEVLSFTGDPWVIAGLRNRNYVLTQKRKERYVCSPSVPFPFPQLPILTNGQWSILAALAAQRL
jgi:hypothetical protein